MSTVGFSGPVRATECACPCGFNAIIVCEADNYYEYCPSCGLDGYDSPAPQATDVEMAARTARKERL